MLDQIFKYAISLIDNLFNVKNNELLKKHSTQVISDIKKILILKFYNLEISNIVNFLKEKFGCYHSNIVYLHNKANDLYLSDNSFKTKYELFSEKLDIFIKRNKLN